MEPQAERNQSIDCLRLVVILLNAGTHSGLLAERFPRFNLFFFEALAQEIIPIFLAISGYYVVSAMLAGKHVFRKHLAAYLRCYLVWTAVYYAFALADFAMSPDRSWGKFLAERVLYFFTRGSYYHLWYFVALIYAFLAVSLVHRLAGSRGLVVFASLCILLHIVGALGMTYYRFGRQLPLLGPLYDQAWFSVAANILCRGFPFFSAGVFLVLLEPALARWSRRRVLLLLLACLGALLLETWLLVFRAGAAHDRLKISLLQYPAALMVVGAAIRFPLPSWRRLGALGKNTATFVYCVHALILTALLMVFGRLGLAPGSVVVFALTLLLSAAGYRLCARFDNRWTRMLRGMAP